MDSPLDFFRRNQKTLLPVIAIGCMVAFVVLPGLLQMLQDRNRESNSKDPVVARWQGGELRQQELQYEVNEHRLLVHFLTQLVEQRALSGGFGVEEQIKFQQLFSLLRLGPQDIRNAVDLKLYDQLGKDSAIAVTEQQANKFLDEVCTTPERGVDGKLTGRNITVISSQVFNETLRNITKNSPSFTEARVFQLIRRLQLREEVVRLFSLQSVFAAETPLARWENYRRMRQRSAIQAIPVRVEEFIKGVREPKAEELAEFFEAHKNKPANADSPEVGLRTPVRASFQLAFINMDRLVSSFKPRIENKAISDFYEKNKVALFQKPKLPAIDPNKPADPTAPVTPEGKPDETKPDDSKPAESKPADGGSKEAPKTEPATTEPGKTEPAKTEPAKSEQGKSEPTKTEPATTEPAKSSPVTPEQAAPKKQSGLTRGGLLPVNFQADPKKEPAKETPPAKDAATEPAKEDPAKSEPAKTEPTKEDSAKSEPAKEEPAKEEPAKEEPAKEEPAKEESAKSEPIEYLSLEEVEGKIRDALAQDRANLHVETLLQKIEDEMYGYKKRRDRVIKAAEDSSKVPFEAFDMAKTIAAIESTIEAETLTLVSYDQFAKHPVSKTVAMFNVGNGANEKSQLQLFQVALSEKIFPVYEPIRTSGDTTGRYIIWKTEQRPDEVPVLTDLEVKKRTIMAWKTLEARKDAEKQAQQYADTAKKAEKIMDKPQTLVELFNAKVLPVSPNEIGNFSWMTPGLQAGDPPTITTVSGLENAGNELMREIFNLQQGQIGVAANQPKTFYYVIQVTETSDLEKLRQSFLEDVRTTTGWRQFARANIDEQDAEINNFFERLRQRYKVEFTNTPLAESANNE